MQTSVQQRASSSRQASARTSSTRRMAVTVPRASLRSAAISTASPLTAGSARSAVRGAQRTSRKVVQVRALFGGAPKTAVTGSFYDFEVKDIEGKTIKLDKYKGQVLLVVNLASACGFTPQYAELQTLYNKYKAKGFSVLGFPCNQFGGQEPGSNSEIKRFATSNYGVTFPLFSKVDVNGNNAEPVFNFLKASKGELFGADVKWNFSKFLIAKDGTVVNRFPSTTPPSAIALEIEKLL